MADTLSAPAPRRGRGRPKGTGIDDAALLTQVRAILRADPLLKSTTAIKRIGISDPSIIRRLRDKLKSRDEAINKRATKSQRRTADGRTSVASTSESEPPKRPASGPPAIIESDQERRTRSALLLATYLEALAKSAPQNSPPSQAATSGDPSEGPTVVHAEKPKPPPAPPTATPAPETKTRQSTPLPEPTTPFHFPGMPPFLQPFRQTTAPEASTKQHANQLEGMKLAVEAMTTMAKLQLHITENAMAYSPMALMLQGQTFIGQMLLASFTGQLDASKKRPPE